jgi:putative transposase
MISSESRQGRHLFVSNRLDLVFRTKHDHQCIPEDLQSRLWAYIGGICKRLEWKLYQVGGARDHVHIFFGLPSSMALGAAVRKIKSNSSAWLRQQPHMAKFEWQKGYGAFSVSISHSDATMAYIRKQKDHHARRDFDGELQEIMRRHGVVPRDSGHGRR